MKKYKYKSSLTCVNLSEIYDYNLIPYKPFNNRKYSFNLVINVSNLLPKSDILKYISTLTKNSTDDFSLHRICTYLDTFLNIRE